MIDLLWIHPRLFLPVATCLGLALAPACGGGVQTAKPVSQAEFASEAGESNVAAIEHSSTVASTAERDSREEEEERAEEEQELAEVPPVRRSLTRVEKKRVIAGYRVEKAKAFKKARKEARSADRLTAGIHKRELEKIAAYRRLVLKRISAAQKTRLRPIRRQIAVAVSAEAAAKRAARKELEAARKNTRVRDRTIRRIEAKLERAVQEARHSKEAAVDAAKSVVRAAQQERDVANEAARSARGASRLSKKKAVRDAAKIKRQARSEAVRTYREGCRALDSATITDYYAVAD